MHIKIDELSKSFGTQSVLDAVTLDLDAKCLALIGPSGGGKSTLLKIMGGLLSADAGSLSLDGKRLPQTESELISWRKKLGYVFQQGGLFAHMSALDNIVIPLCEVHGCSKEEAHERAYELLERFGLKDTAHKFPRELSGGQQQRVAIARAVSARPHMLLLDEPTSALDPEYTSEVLSLLDELRQEGMHFIMVTHEMGFARHACDAVAFLHGGHIVEAGNAEGLFSHPQTDELAHFLEKLLAWDIS